METGSRSSSRKSLHELPPTAPPPPSPPIRSKPVNLLDTQIVIVLGAILCGLICAVWLHSVVRCVVRRNRRQPVAGVSASPAPDPGDESAGGLDVKTIAMLPVVPATVDVGDHRQLAVATVASLSSNAECIVCLQEFAAGEEMKLLPNCGHGFHIDCIGAWLLSHSSCPICRHAVLEPPSPSPSTSPSNNSSSSLLLASPLMRQFQRQLLDSQQRSQRSQANLDLLRRLQQRNRLHEQQFEQRSQPPSSLLGMLTRDPASQV